MSEILEQLQVNKTFFVQFGLFVGFFFVLKSLYLKPFQKLIEKRNHKLKNDVDAATDLLKSVEIKIAEYEKEISQARTDARVEYEKIIASIKSKEEAAVYSYREDLKKEFQKASSQLQEEKKKVETELKAQVSTMADLVAQKALAGK